MTTLRLLVFGAAGQVGTELRRLAGPDLEVVALGRAEADLRNPAACAEQVARRPADVVINAAAWTAVDRAEADEAEATRVNAEAPGAMARAAAAQGAPFLHLSTDYVFSGEREDPWPEDAPTGPLGAYGRSKLAGERAVGDAGGPHVVLRTAWVFAGHGSNFVRSMLRAGRGRDRLNVVDDQRGGPTAAADLAAALVWIARAFAGGHGVSGVFHYCGVPATTWRGFAEEIFRRADWVRSPRIVPISSAEWPTPAPRPRNSELDCAKIAAVYGITQPDWRPALDAALAELRRAEEDT